MRVLVIDDDDVARELLRSVLEQVGYRVFELPSAIGATRAIYEHDVVCVVVDVTLPDISGDKLAKVLRGNPRGRQLGIVLVSSRPEAQLRVLAEQADADGLVTKSQVRKELAAVVARACERRTSPRQP